MVEIMLFLQMSTIRFGCSATPLIRATHAACAMACQIGNWRSPMMKFDQNEELFIVRRYPCTAWSGRRALSAATSSSLRKMVIGSDVTTDPRIFVASNRTCGERSFIDATTSFNCCSISLDMVLETGVLCHLTCKLQGCTTGACTKGIRFLRRLRKDDSTEDSSKLEISMGQGQGRMPGGVPNLPGMNMRKKGKGDEKVWFEWDIFTCNFEAAS